MIILETDRLTLRQFTWDDLDDIAAILAEPEGMKHIGPGTPRSKDEVKQWMSKWIEDGEYAWSEETLARVPQLKRAPQRSAHFSMWATVDRSTGKLIGRCGLLAWNLDGNLEVEVGYQLTQACWGYGLATEAARGIRDYGMDRLGFDRLISVIKPANTASCRVAEKIGMRHERDTMVKEWPVCIYKITRAERD